MINRREFLQTGSAVAALAMVGQSVLAKSAVAGGSAGKTIDKTLPVYEIYALKYAGPFKSKLAFVYYKNGWDQDYERYYYIWAVKGEKETILVDTGVGPTLAAKKKVKNWVNPVDVFSRLNIPASNVKKIIISHMHWDHAAGMEIFPQAFPEAVFYVQKQEYDFWINNPIAKKKVFAGSGDAISNKVIQEMEGTNRLRLISGDEKIGPGLDVLLTPGHTPALQSLAVNTKKGIAIVASDCAHIKKSFEEDWPSSLICDLPGWMQSFDKLKARAASPDLIFPGHDAGLLNDYPKVAEDITRLV